MAKAQDNLAICLFLSLLIFFKGSSDVIVSSCMSPGIPCANVINCFFLLLL